MRRAHRPLVALVAGLALLAGACGGSDNRPSLAPEKTTVSGAAAPTTATLAPGTSFIAQAAVPTVSVYDAPGASTPSRQFQNPWFVNNDPKLPVQTVFLVQEQRDDWVRVLLPVRPNGSTGWVRAGDVKLVPNRFRIDIDLSDHELVAYNGDQVVLQDTVAVGAPDTPTPIGKFYIVVLLKAPDPTTVYGPFAYGLSSHSETLSEFNGGDAEIGIHGNNDASVLGTDVSHGCIRMSNDQITRLTTMLPLGTPVVVHA